MNRDITVRVLFVFLLVAVLASAYQVIAPFLAGFTWAVVLVAAFRPFHQRITERLGGRQGAATAVVTLLVATFVAAPLIAAAVAAAQGGIQAIHWIVANYGDGGSSLGLRDRWPWVGDLLEHAKASFGLAAVDLRTMAISGLARLGSLIAARGPALVGGALGLLFSFIVTLIAMPPLFANWERLSQSVADLLPIPAADASRIVDELTTMTRCVFRSTLVTAAAQAGLGGIGLFVLGVPQVWALTAVMFFCALMPGGTAIVWVPAAVWLGFSGHPGKAIALVAWGGGVVSTIDNVLRPVLAGKGVELNGGALLVGMLGGMAAFGIVGLFLGPIVLYLAHQLLLILRRETRGAPELPVSRRAG